MKLSHEGPAIAVAWLPCAADIASVPATDGCQQSGLHCYRSRVTQMLLSLLILSLKSLDVTSGCNGPINMSSQLPHGSAG